MNTAIEPRDVVTDALRHELRRGTLVLAVLSVLQDESYGAAVQTALAKAGVIIEPGALYPMLRRLETQGLLGSHWRHEGSRNRRLYQTSIEGRAALETLLAELIQLTHSLQKLMETAR